MEPKPVDQFELGQKVMVTQQIPQRDKVWTTRITGHVLGYEQRKTGSWYAHAKDDKLWLDRLILQKDDGEVVVCTLDLYTHVQCLDPDEQLDATTHDQEAPPDSP